MAKKTNVLSKNSKSILQSPVGFVAFAVIFGLIGYFINVMSLAAGPSSVSVIAPASGTIHYSDSIRFNWSANYKNNTSNTYFNPNIEVICYQNGIWTGMGHVYRMSTSPTPTMSMSGIHNYTFAEGDLNRLDYGWNPNTAAPSNCHVGLYYFSKSNNKYMELASTTFQIIP